MESSIKLQTSVIILSVLTPIVLASLYIGDMAGRLKTLESDRDYSAIKKERNKLFLQTDKKFEETRKKADETINLLQAEISLSKTEIETYKEEQNIVVEEFKKNIKEHTTKANKKLNYLINQIHLKEKRLKALNKEIWKKKKVLEPITNAINVIEESNTNVIKKKVKQYNNKYVIRLGVFSLESGAKKLHNDLAELEVSSYIENKSNLYKVEVGPFLTKKEAEKELQNIQMKFPNGTNAKEAYVLYRQ